MSLADGDEGELEPLFEGSGQVIVYNPHGEWFYSMMQVRWDRHDGNNPTTTAVLDRPLNGFHFPCRDVEDVMEEAYADDGVNCVVRQICARYNLEREAVEAEFNEIGDWSEGITPLSAWSGAGGGR